MHYSVDIVPEKCEKQHFNVYFYTEGQNHKFISCALEK